MPAIYVEILVRAPLDALWRATQDPSVHELWDLRFSSIAYLPRPTDDEPQRFRYATRIGFGLEIVGEGESVTQRDLPGGVRVSSLKFSSSHPLSLISEGGGYWKYVPVADGIRFFTWYDYRTRFGLLGKIIDRLAFRPLLGWATAFSFDTMRLWLERGISPRSSRIQATVHAIARLSLAVAFAWIGFAFQLLSQRSAASVFNMDGPFLPLTSMILSVAYCYIALSAALILFWKRAWIVQLAWILMIVVTAATQYRFDATAPELKKISCCLAITALSMLDLLALSNLPTASMCLRKDPEGRL
jgi:hypothetical protein